MQALLSRGLAAGTPSDLVAKLRGLFRWEQTPSIGEGPLDTGVTPLRLEEKAFSEALRSGGRRSAPGPVGWRYEHLRTVLQLPRGTRSLMRVAQLLVDGQVPGPIVSHLGGASLTPLAKPNGGVRPGSPPGRCACKARSLLRKTCSRTSLGWACGGGASWSINVSPRYVVWTLMLSSWLWISATHTIVSGGRRALGA